MKCSPLLPQLALVLAVVYACTDSTAPANPRSLLSPGNPLGARGDPPPPPVDAAMNICVGGAGCAAFDGTYFSNGATSVEAAVAAAEVGDLSLVFDGTAWLKLDNRQPSPDGTASPNTRFKRHDAEVSGKGTLVINGQTVVITAVLEFIPNPDCGTPGDPCAEIVFEATVNGVTQTGSVTAFDREGCTLFTGEGSFYSCPPEGS